MDLTVVAAFTAAGLSLINVIITASLAHRANLQQWQRTEGQPIVARILVASREATLAWGQAAFARHSRLRMDDDAAVSEKRRALDSQEREHWATGHNAWDKLRAEVALLDLVAGQQVRDAAQALLLGQESVGISIRPNGPSTDPLRAVYQSDVGLREKDLVEKARADIGLRQRTVWQRLLVVVAHRKSADGSAPL